MRKHSRFIISIVLSISVLLGIIGFAILTSDKAMAVPVAASGKTIKAITENTETKLTFTDGDAKWLSFTPSKTGLYEFFTYNNTAGDPGLYWFKGDTLISYCYTNSGKDANEYQYMSMTAGQIYYFRVVNDKDQCTKSNGTISFKVRNVQNNVTTISLYETKSLVVNTDSYTKWFAFTPEATGTLYKFRSDSGSVEVNKEDSSKVTSYVRSGDYYASFSEKKQYFFCVRDITTSNIDVSIGTDGTNLTGAVDSVTGNRTGNKYTVNSGQQLTFTVSPQAKDKTSLKYKWIDSNDNVLSSSTNTLTYTATSSLIVTCKVTDQYLNSVNVIYNITCNSVSYSVTVDVKNGDNDITVNGISTGSYSASRSFTVSCNKACRVFVSKDNGSTYSKLQYSSANGNAHTYYLEITGNLKVVIVKAGDFNMDGKVDSADALQVLRVDVNKASAGALEKIIADLDGNSKLDSADALQILRSDVGKATFEW